MPHDCSGSWSCLRPNDDPSHEDRIVYVSDTRLGSINCRFLPVNTCVSRFAEYPGPSPYDWRECHKMPDGHALVVTLVGVHFSGVALDIDTKRLRPPRAAKSKVAVKAN